MDEMLREHPLRSVVLLKNGMLEIVDCPSDAVFSLARVRDAGICGVFPNREQANHYLARIISSDRKIPSGGCGLPKS